MRAISHPEDTPAVPQAVAGAKPGDPTETESASAVSDALDGGPVPAVGLSIEPITTLVFQSLLLGRGALHVVHREWITAAQAIDVVWPALSSSSNRRLSGDRSWVFDLGDALVRLFLSPDGVARASFAVRDLALLARAEEALLELLPAEGAGGDLDSDGGLVPVTFWCWGGMRRSTRRRLLVPSWAEIYGNYASATRALLGPLFDGFRPSGDGQLILWHGAPGTGKTHAIRALADAWRSWCDVHYVMDPDVFFGQPASYMRDVLLDNDDEYEFDQRNHDEERNDGRWRLLVLEDTGELLNVDAKLDVGQGLSRLLNVVDGLLGQGLRVLVLITTNEPIARLHPAVVRPGRCAMTAEFVPLPAGEANVWLDAHGAAAITSVPISIAELYNSAAGGQPSAAERRVGFA
jgi:ATPase family protein associated with various cellular activities (AAA)